MAETIHISKDILMFRILAMNFYKSISQVGTLLEYFVETFVANNAEPKMQGFVWK